MRILVTGGAGFIGSHVVNVLIARGHAVTALDKPDSRKDNIKNYLTNPNFRLIEGDILDTEAVKKSLSGVDAVVHEAALPSVPFSIKEPELTHKVNVEGTLSLLRASKAAGVKRFVFASSCAVYGDPERLPITEDTPPKPRSPYASSKLEAEEHCRKFFESEKLPTVALRYFNVYGPRQSGGEYSGVMVKFMQRIRDNQPPIIYGDGKQTRDFVYVTDVAEATLLALEREGAAGEVVNVGTGKETRIDELCELFLKLAGTPHLKPIHEAPKSGEIKRSLADISKARKLLGFKPKISIEEGTNMLWESFGGR